MSYISWFNEHAKKHKALVDKLVAKKLSQEEIIEYFSWGNISKTDVDFCPLFVDGKKCHDMQELNCYLCACPNFRFDDAQEKVKSHCSIDSKDGEQAEYGGIIHQNCSGCTVPHHKSYVKKHFDLDWHEIMKKCHD